MIFSPEGQLIHHETYLIEACLSNGLTSLRKADLNKRGEFYSAFFNLSIGIERMLKITLIIDYMVKNNLQCPTSNRIRKLSHDILKLILKANECCSDNVNQLDIIQGKTSYEIITFLDTFASKSRYYNLDSLSSRQSLIDPLSHWCKILHTIYKNEISEKKKNKINAISVKMGSTIDRIAYVLADDLEQNALNPVTVFSEPQIIETATPYAIWHIVEILQQIRDIQFHLSDIAYGMCVPKEKPKIPYMRESYTFLNWDKSYHLKKKKWN